MFGKTKNMFLALIVLMFASSITIAQESKDNDEPVGPGQGPNVVFGPDGFGYQGYDSAEPECSFNFIDISGTGAVIIADGDDTAVAQALGGTGFNFYGTQLTQVAAASNGYISSDPTDTGGDLSNDCPLPVSPSTGGGSRFYPLHDDLDIVAPNGSLFYEYFADCPRQGVLPGDGCHIFQWNNIIHFGGAAEFTFQAVLYELSGAIVYQHLAGNTEAGSGSTTGIQNLGATIGLTYACDTAASVAADSAQCIYNPDFLPFGVPGAAGFQVDKTFDDGNPGEVEVTISCNTGLPLQQSDTISEGDGVTFIVGNFEDGTLDCEVTETDGADGYTTSYNNAFEISDESCAFEDANVGVRYVCNISNALEQVEVEVTKWWMDENPGFNSSTFAEANYSCVNEVFEEAFGSLQFFDDGDTDSFFVYPDWDGTTVCNVTETLVDSGVEFDDSECESLSVAPGEGASCNLYNTRLYEGIPTLSQYGLGLLALLMLGMGFVAFRRFV